MPLTDNSGDRAQRELRSNMMKRIEVPKSGGVFHNNAAYRIGTGRTGLALREEYIEHYDCSAKAVKQADDGVPTICGVDTERWLRSFFTYCIQNDSPLNFITPIRISAMIRRNFTD